MLNMQWNRIHLDRMGSVPAKHPISLCYNPLDILPHRLLVAAIVGDFTAFPWDAILYSQDDQNLPSRGAEKST